MLSFVPEIDKEQLSNALETLLARVVEDKNPAVISEPRVALKGDASSIKNFLEKEDLSWHYEKELFINGRTYFIAYDFDLSQ